MKNILILSFILVSINLYGQDIDSVKVLDQNIPPKVHIFGKLLHTGYSITDIETQITNTIVLNVFFKECDGFLAITPFDTLVSYTATWPVVPSNIKIVSILDTNTIDSSCFIINQFDTLGINNFPASMLNVKDFYMQNQINIYPNPTKDIIKIEANDNLELERIRLVDVNGKLIKEFTPNTTNLNVKGLPNGIYFLKFKTTNGIFTEKVIVQ